MHDTTEITEMQTEKTEKYTETFEMDFGSWLVNLSLKLIVVKHLA